jgi:pimeloyl-ACP methyl ester carboxylesterase
MEKIRSNDGTSIAYQRGGKGAPLILVHGTMGSHESWTGIRPALEQHFSVYAVDRRGYGESGDSPNYAIDRDAEDLAALVNAIGGEVSLLGHSYGGLCVLEATLLAPLRRLIVYEPSPLPIPGKPLYAEGMVDRLQALLDAGERENVVMTVFRELVGTPPDELEHLRASPRFPTWVSAAHTVPRETRAEETYQFEPDRFKHLTVPVLLLLGGDSPQTFKTTIETWHNTLPNSRVGVLPGQQHLAQYTAPDLFVQAISTFLLEPDP